MSVELNESDWEEYAACKGKDTELFFLPDGMQRHTERLQRINSAKEICDECPVRQACLVYAIDTNQTHGVWGGASEDERRNMRSRGLRSLEQLPLADKTPTVSSEDNGNQAVSAIVFSIESIVPSSPHQDYQHLDSRFIGGLTDRQSTFLNLSAGGATNTEIANLTGKSLKNVGKGLNAARKKYYANATRNSGH